MALLTLFMSRRTNIVNCHWEGGGGVLLEIYKASGMHDVSFNVCKMFNRNIESHNSLCNLLLDLHIR